MSATIIPFIRVQRLSKSFQQSGGSLFHRHRKYVQAVRDVSFDIERGETFGLVGESGCGKTTTGRLLLRLYEPDQGVIELNGTDILKLSHRDFRILRPKIQAIFQDPYSSLNPRQTAFQTIAEVLRVHKLARDDTLVSSVEALCDKVGLPKQYLQYYPSQFSGGQRQRLGIARALACQPAFIIADEPVSALDVSMQAQILNLLKDLQDAFGLTYLFISHDLSIVRYLCDRLAVMYLGEIVEMGTAEDVFLSPGHPYTEALLNAIPAIDRQIPRIIEGDIPAGIHIPAGCGFHTRCPYVESRCTTHHPQLQTTASGRSVRCILNKGEGLVKKN